MDDDAERRWIERAARDEAKADCDITVGRVGPNCGRCFAEVDEIFPPTCSEKPELVRNLGMYHCPECGAMVLGGMPHWWVCATCRDFLHEGFDRQWWEVRLICVLRRLSVLRFVDAVIVVPPIGGEPPS